MPVNDRSADERLAHSGGDRVARALAAHGVRQIFTLCGGHTAPVLAAAKARGMRIIDVRHEVNAVFAADACARLGGVPGVAVVTAGPGVSNAVTALTNAQLAQSPLVLIGGAAPTALQGRGALQDIDQRALIAPHVKGCRLVRSVANLDRAVTEAFALAQEGVAGPVFVECPVDLLYDEATIRGWYSDASARGNSLAAIAQRWYLRRHVERMFSGSADDSTPKVAPVSPPEPGKAGIDNAVAALLRAERPLLLVGSQALAVPARAQLVAAAVVASGLPVYLSGMARGLLGRSGPYQCFHQRRKALREADCVVLAGVPSDFRLDYGRHVRKDATLIAANRSRREARMNRRPMSARSATQAAFSNCLARVWPGACSVRRGCRTCASATPNAKPKSTRLRNTVASTSIRWPCFAKSIAWLPTTRSSSSTAAISPRLPRIRCIRAVR